MTPITTPAFRTALARLEALEGGWSDNPDDRGGRTKYGITERTWTDYHNGRPPYDIAQITRDDAREIYWGAYWRAAGINRLEASGVPQILLTDLLDAVVHHGVRGGSGLLQRAYNMVCGKRAPLDTDGVIGAKTCAAIASFCLNQDYAKGLLGAFRYLRGWKFAEICQHDPTQAKFLCGWMRRLV